MYEGYYTSIIILAIQLYNNNIIISVSIAIALISSSVVSYTTHEALKLASPNFH